MRTARLAGTSNALTGIQNQTVQIIEVESLGVVVSSFAGSELSPTKENIFVHERVIESCMDRVTPLPFRFGAVVQEEKLEGFYPRQWHGSETGSGERPGMRRNEFEGDVPKRLFR